MHKATVCLVENTFKVLYSLVTVIIFYVVSKMCLNLHANANEYQSVSFQFKHYGKNSCCIMLVGFYCCVVYA